MQPSLGAGFAEERIWYVIVDLRMSGTGWSSVGINLVLLLDSFLLQLSNNEENSPQLCTCLEDMK